MKISSSKLDISCGKSTSIKFLKDPSTRGNSPNFQKQKMKMKPILLSIKPVNKWFPLKFNLSNRANLVNSIGIGPRKRLRICQQHQSFLSKNLKSCLSLRLNFEDTSCYKIELEMELGLDLFLSRYPE